MLKNILKHLKIKKNRLLFGHLDGEVVCEKFNYVAIRRNSMTSVRWHVTCRQRGNYITCVFHSLKFKLLLKKKKILRGFDRSVPKSEFRQSTNSFMADYVFNKLSIKLYIVGWRWSRFK